MNDYFKDWMKVINRTELLKVLSTVGIEYKNKVVCPKQTDVFKAFKLCPFNDLKMVFLGYDPYPQKDVATGILFGNKKDVEEDKLSTSLKVIKEAAINFEVPHNCIIFDQTLESWAKQGILMLNSALTVEMNMVGSHVMLWRPFISSLLKEISNRCTGIVYVLFGKQAQTFIPYINIKNNTVIKIEHPAYFARNNIKMPHKFFVDLNNLMKEKYGVPIEWYKEY
jgi:uracil-DNA glycosylase